jgi:hypothetical protein
MMARLCLKMRRRDPAMVDRARYAARALKLKQELQRWTNLVESLATSRWGPCNVDLCEFANLRRRISAACHDLADASDADQRKLYEDLEATVRPWLSPRVLAETDGELLAGLLARWRRIEGELSGRTPARPVWLRSALVFTLLVAAATTGGVVFLSTVPVPWAALGETVQDLSPMINHTLGRSSDTDMLVALAVVAILLSVYNVSRTARS